MKWIRLRDEKPPVNTKLLVLIDGVVREGYLDEVMLLGNVIPTVFQTVRYPDSGYMSDWQHSHWGHDPYWMLCPEKPVQEQSEKLVSTGGIELPPNYFEEKRERMERSIEVMKAMTDDELITVSQCYSQGDVQKQARLILAERKVIYRHETGWVYTDEFLARSPQEFNGHWRGE